MNATLDTEISLQADLRAGVPGRSGGNGGPAGTGQGGDAREEETAEAFGRRLYKIRTAVNHAIEAHYQAMAGAVNSDKLRMLVEGAADGSIRCGNYQITQMRQ